MAKLLLTLTVLSCFGAALVKGGKKEFITKLVQEIDECKPEVGATETDINEFVGNKPSSTMEAKCLRACIMKKRGVMDSNGKFVTSAALRTAEDYTDGDAVKMKMTTKIIEACSGIAVSDDHCEAADQYGKCFQAQSAPRGKKTS